MPQGEYDVQGSRHFAQSLRETCLLIERYPFDESIKESVTDYLHATCIDIIDFLASIGTNKELDAPTRNRIVAYVSQAILSTTQGCVALYHEPSQEESTTILDRGGDIGTPDDLATARLEFPHSLDPLRR